MSAYYVAAIPYSDELYHFGIKGQKWGIRRYQNDDGSYTPAGKERYRFLSSDLQNKRNASKKSALDYEAAKEARDKYKIIKRNSNSTQEEKYIAKQRYKELGTKKKVAKAKLEAEQAKWEETVSSNKLNKFRGLATTKVSALSPKNIDVGKRIAKAVAMSAAGALATSAVAAGAAAYGASMVIGDMPLAELAAILGLVKERVSYHY